MNYTPNYKLQKDLTIEKYDVNVVNMNSDIIDSALHRLDLKDKSQDELLATKEALNSETTRAITKENEIVEDLTSEITRAQSAENANANNLTNEIARATIAEETINQILETKANQTELENYLPITGGTLSNENSAILTLHRNVDGGAKLTFENSAGILGAIEFSRDGICQLWDKEDNIFAQFAATYAQFIRDGVAKKILVDGDALPAKDRTVSGDLKIKGGFFPLLNLVRNEYDETAAIQLTNGSVEQKGFLLEGYLKDSEGSERNFHIRDRLVNKEIFRVSVSERKIYDEISDSLKNILVEGEALPATGGTIESTANPLLKMRRTLSQGDAILQLLPNNFTDKGINVQAAFPPDTNKLTLKVFQVGVDTESGVNCLLEISDGLRRIYDYKTNGMKEILVNGEALLLEGGATELKKPANRVLVLNNTGTGTLTEIAFKLRGVEKSVITSREDAGFDFYDSTRKIVLARITNDALLYKGKKILVEGSSIDNCTVDGKKLSEIYGTNNDSGIFYSDSEPTSLSTGMTWIGI